VKGVDAGGLVELLAARAREWPERVAFRVLRSDAQAPAGRTYRELYERVTSVGEGLRQITGAGERVALLFPAGLEFIDALLGSHHAGLAAVPLQPPLGAQAPARLGDIIADAAPAIGLTTEALLPRIRRYAEDVRAFAAIEWHAIERLPAGAGAARRRGDPGDVALLQYTSGSTGMPKGVMLTHANLLCNAAQVHVAFGEPAYADDRMVCWLPPFHDMGLMSGVIGPIFSGIEAILLSPLAVAQRPARWLEAIGQFGATLSGAPNFGYDQCTTRIPEDDRRTLRLDTWRVAFCGAEPIRAGTLERFARVFAANGFRSSAFLPSYGLAEATVAVSGGREAAPVSVTLDAEALQAGAVAEIAGPGRALVACGRPVPGGRIVIVDLETRRECPVDRVGEIWVQGANVAAGYWRQPELTRATFDARLDNGDGPFLRTGDLGFVRDGRLFVTGRAKDVIIIRGRNYYPHDIEATAERSTPALVPGGSAAFGVDGPDGERLVVLQEVRRTARADRGGVCDAIRAAIAQEHSIAPSAIVLVDQGRLPKTTSGKIRRDACRAMLSSADLEALEAWCADPSAWPDGILTRLAPARFA
jgi:acyl-CoA synthetase (AMP-forming)/AMP-acid ligase II